MTPSAQVMVSQGGFCHDVPLQIHKVALAFCGSAISATGSGDLRTHWSPGLVLHNLGLTTLSVSLLPARAAAVDTILLSFSSSEFPQGRSTENTN